MKIPVSFQLPVNPKLGIPLASIGNLPYALKYTKYLRKNKLILRNALLLSSKIAINFIKCYQIAANPESSACSFLTCTILQ